MKTKKLKTRYKSAQYQAKKSEIDNKVAQIITRLAEIRTRQVLECYDCLGRIFDLRKELYPNYTIANLYREVSELFSSYEEMLKIMQLRFATPKTRELILQKKVRATTICSLLGYKVLQDEITQNDFIEKMLTKGWNSTKAQLNLTKVTIYKREQSERRPTITTQEAYTECEQDIESEPTLNETNHYTNVLDSVQEAEIILANNFPRLSKEEQAQVLLKLNRLTKRYLEQEYIAMDEDVKCLLEIIRSKCANKNENTMFYIKQALQSFSRLVGYRGIQK